MPVDPHGEKHLETLNTYSQLKKLPKLKSIDIALTYIIEDDDDDQNGDIAEILNRILKAGASSVLEITLRTPIGQLPFLVFPVMKRLTKLNLLFHWFGSDKTSFTECLRAGEIFPDGFKFSVLPNLKEVVIQLETDGQGPQHNSRFDCWKNNLQFCGIAKRVKIIHYNDDCGFSKQRLKITFPNAKWTKASDFNVTYTSSEGDSEEASSSSLEEEQFEYEQD